MRQCIEWFCGGSDSRCSFARGDIALEHLDKTVKAGIGHGLHSVRERLRLAFGEQASLQVEQAQGTTVRISLPVLC
jgi:LytS/YehU family sensor histidine kinase